MKTKLSLFLVVLSVPSLLFSELLDCGSGVYHYNPVQAWSGFWPGPPSESVTTPYGANCTVSPGDYCYWTHPQAYFGGTIPILTCFKSSKTIPVGMVCDENGVCKPPVLSDYDKDPAGCSKAGGTFISTGTEQVGGTSYGASFFGGSGIILGGDIKAITKCATPAEAVGSVASLAAGLIPMLSKLFGSSAMKKLTNVEWINALNKYTQPSGSFFKPSVSSNMPDTYVGLPKLSKPSTPTVTPSTPTVSSPPTVPITPSPVPTVSGGTSPIRAPQIGVDSGYSVLNDYYIPTKTSGDPVIDYSVVNRANTFIQAEVSPQLSSIIPNIGSSYVPVRETFDFSNVISDHVQPSIIANVPTSTTKTSYYSGSDPIDAYRTVTNYPDGSSSLQTVRVNSATQRGDLTVTNLASTGESNTISRSFTVSNYASNSSSNTIPSNPISFTAPMTSTSPVTIPDAQTNTSSTLNPDGSTVSRLSDGSTYTVNSDGSTQTLLSNGTTTTTPSTTTFKYDGTSQTTFLDGTIKTSFSDGTIQYASPTGQISTTVPLTLTKPSFKFADDVPTSTGISYMNSDGSVSTINPNGSVTTTNLPNGDTLVVNPNGSTTTTSFNGTSTSTSSTSSALLDGSVKTTYPDGSTKIIMPNGSVQYSTPTGQINTTIPQTPSNADGTITVSNFDGGTTTINPNGTSVTTSPNGTTSTVNLDGTTTTIKPDGTTTTSKPDGSSITNQPYGTTTTVYPDGSTSTSHSDGTTTTTNSTTITTPEGTTQTSFPDGTTITKSNGTTTITKSDGTTTTSKPDGSIETKFPEGTIKNVDPTGITNYITPNGKTTAPLPQPSSTSGETCPTTGGGNPSDLINAKMPNFSFSDFVDFKLYDSTPIQNMVDSVDLMFTNINTQLNNAKTTFDDTKAMLEGKWEPPVFPEGSCGDSMAFNFHGRNVDFCPPVMNFTSQYSPLFSAVTSIAGTGLAISIFLGGF